MVFVHPPIWRLRRQFAEIGVKPACCQLVPSDRVERANVYGRDGAKLGTIERLTRSSPHSATSRAALISYSNAGALSLAGFGCGLLRPPISQPISLFRLSC